MATCTKVTVRQRPKGKEQMALYLDFYPPIRVPETMHSTRRESLGLTIWSVPKNEIQRQHNKEMEMKAEAIRSVRVQALINEQFGFLDTRKKRGDFLAYFKKHARQKGAKWLMVYAHFNKFIAGHCTFGEVTVELCNRFRDYLLKAKQLRHTDSKLSTNSAAAYFTTFRAMLRVAYRNKMLQENINDFLEAIPTRDTKKEYLTLDQIKQLAATPCRIEVLRRASLFSFMTGLRISDILQLDWSMIEPSPFGSLQMRFKSIKPDTEITLPINDEALELMGDRREEGLGLVIIDGVRDLSYDINSPSEATEIINRLMTWTDERNIHIHTVLHQNKGDDNARGHLGSELNNKAETVLQVVKSRIDPEQSIVSPVHIRSIEFNAFAFYIDSQGLNQLVEDFSTTKTTRGFKYEELTDEEHYAVLEEIFQESNEFRYAELIIALTAGYATNGYEYGRNKIIELNKFLKNKGFTFKEGKRYRLKPQS